MLPSPIISFSLPYSPFPSSPSYILIFFCCFCCTCCTFFRFLVRLLFTRGIRVFLVAFLLLNLWREISTFSLARISSFLIMRRAFTSLWILYRIFSSDCCLLFALIFLSFDWSSSFRRVLLIGRLKVTYGRSPWRSTGFRSLMSMFPSSPPSCSAPSLLFFFTIKGQYKNNETQPPSFVLT